MHRGVTVTDAGISPQTRELNMLISVSEEVLFTEANFNKYCRETMRQMIKMIAGRFLKEHQEWIREVFNVQTLRIALLEELQRRITEMVDVVDKQ